MYNSNVLGTVTQPYFQKQKLHTPYLFDLTIERFFIKAKLSYSL